MANGFQRSIIPVSIRLVAVRVIGPGRSRRIDGAEEIRVNRGGRALRNHVHRSGIGRQIVASGRVNNMGETEADEDKENPAGTAVSADVGWRSDGIYIELEAAAWAKSGLVGPDSHAAGALFGGGHGSLVYYIPEKPGG